MIKTIKLEGFKCFYDLSLELNWLTVLTGLNNSGKSSVIQALRMMENSFHNSDSIQIEGHGTDEEIHNKFHDSNIILGITDSKGKEFITEILLDNKNKAYTKKKNEFSFPEIIYVSANRYGPKTSIPIYTEKSKKHTIGPNGENTLQCIEIFSNSILDKRLIHEKSEGDTFFYNLRGWLSEISPNVKFDYSIEKPSDSSYTTFNGYRATNVGYGLSYTLPILVALLVGTLIPNSIVILENPEAHLHPKGQTAIAKLISLCANIGTQIIVETHSDHIFNGIRIETKNLSGLYNKVKVHWFEVNDQDVEIFTPNINSKGKIDLWPKNFFDQFEINSSKLI